MNDPLPALTGPFPRLSPSFCTTAGESIIPERSVRVARSGENGFLSSKRTWEESTVTTDCTFDISLKRGDDGVDNIRLMLNTTASALKGVPSWNFTSLRSVNTNCVGEVYDHAVARSGTMALCSSRLTLIFPLYFEGVAGGDPPHATRTVVNKIMTETMANSLRDRIHLKMLPVSCIMIKSSIR